MDSIDIVDSMFALGDHIEEVIPEVVVDTISSNMIASSTNTVLSPDADSGSSFWLIGGLLFLLFVGLYVFKNFGKANTTINCERVVGLGNEENEQEYHQR